MVRKITYNSYQLQIEYRLGSKSLKKQINKISCVNTSVMVKEVMESSHP